MFVDKRNLIGFIDIASAETRVMISSVDKDGKPVLLGKSVVKTMGFNEGKVLNFSDFSSCINGALDEAEENIRCKVSNVVVSLSDFEYKDYEMSGEMKWSIEKTLSVKDLIDCSRRIPVQDINLDKESLVHIVPLQFIVDDVKVVDNIEGVVAKKLKVVFRIITVDAKMQNDLRKSLEAINLHVKYFVANSYASALSTLIEDDKRAGCLVIDIGRKSVSMAKFVNSELNKIASFNRFGSEILTDVLSKNLNVRYSEAEKLKIEIGATVPTPMDYSLPITINTIGESGENREVEIFKGKFLEVFNHYVNRYVAFLKQNAESKDLLSSVSRIILTGNGSKLKGLRAKISDNFKMLVREATPVFVPALGDDFNDPKYSTLVGLFLFYYDKVSGDYRYDMKKTETKEQKKLWNKVKEFLSENF